MNPVFASPLAGWRAAVACLAVFLNFAVALVLTSQTPPRDHPPQRPEQQTGTGVIRGRVVVEGTNMPFGRVVVFASPAGAVGMTAPDAPLHPLMSTTDEKGGFEIKRVPAGRYFVGAQVPHERPQYLSAAYGQRAPGDRPKPIDVADGVLVENIVIYVQRAGVITGRVLNEAGEPVAWARVTPLLKRSPENEAVEVGPSRETDDLGRFRIFALIPGSYIVRVEPTDWRPDEEQGRQRYVPIFYPSALSQDEAQPVSVEPGDEGAEVEIVLRRARTYRITGIVTSLSGQTSRAYVMFSRDRRNFSSAQVKPDGSFTITGAQPGEYTLVAMTENMGDAEVEPERSAPATVRVEQDVDGVSLTLQRGARISGHVVLDLEHQKAPSSLRVMARSPSIGSSFGSPAFTSVKPDGTFALSRVFGPTVLRFMEGGGSFRLKVTYKGKDITDIPTEFSDVRDARSLELLLTDKGARIRGHVTGGQGLAAGEGVVVAVSADERRWGGWAHSTRFAPVAEGGSFVLGLLAPGKYLVVALESPRGAIDAIMGERDAGVFSKLASIATPVEVLENEVREVALTISKLPQ